MMLPQGFVAYPSYPATLPETIREAVEQINHSKSVYLRTWEQLSVGGRLIINEICRSIESSELFVCDVTGLNLNAMFETGFAIASQRRLWLLLDRTLPNEDFRSFRVLSTLGYHGYANVDEVVKGFFKDAPHTSLQATTYAEVIAPSLQSGAPSSLLYLKSQHETTASAAITVRLDRLPIRLITDDPRESPYQTLTWYGQQVYAAEAVVCHFTNPAREGALLRNARCALVAGMAFAFKKPLLLLSEGDYLSPLDYRDLLRFYPTAAVAKRQVDEWLVPHEERWRTNSATTAARAANIRLATELRALQLGEYVAENEPDGLVDGYFVETAAYRDAQEGRHKIFVGRKGAGKSANFIQLSATLGRDPRCLLAIVKPVAYELQGLMSVLASYTDGASKVYAIESLWKWLLYTEIAAVLYARIRNRPVASLTGGEAEFIRLFEESYQDLVELDFSVRLERAIKRLESLGPAPEGVDAFRTTISEKMHLELLPPLREAIGSALRRGARVAFLVDNLDKAWDKETEFDMLSEFLLGLLGAVSRIASEIPKAAPSITLVSLGVFLRADIFDRVLSKAREPDKILYSRLTWSDPEVLLRIVEERYVASQGADTPPSDLWTRFFCPAVGGRPTRNFLAEHCLPRPRDLLYLVKTCVETAVNRGHSIVEEDDVRKAQVKYSAFAFEILTIEAKASIPNIEDLLLEFAGGAAVLSEIEVSSILAPKLLRLAPGEAVAALAALGFVAPEVRDSVFRFSDTEKERKRDEALAQQLADVRGAPRRYKVHEAFWPYLELRVP